MKAPPVRKDAVSVWNAWASAVSPGSHGCQKSVSYGNALRRDLGADVLRCRDNTRLRPGVPHAYRVLPDRRRHHGRGIAAFHPPKKHISVIKTSLRLA